MLEHPDGCPECLHRGNLPTATEPVPHGVQCTYECGVCGGSWVTAWFDFGGDA